MKKEIKILGIDDAPFKLKSSGRTHVFGVVYRGASFLEGVIHTTVEIDGIDSTDQIVEMILSSPHHQQLKLIMIDGLTVGGFNVIDVNDLFKRVNRPVIVIIEHHPNFNSIKKALRHFSDGNERWQLIQKLVSLHELQIIKDLNPIYFQPIGISVNDAILAIKSCTVNGRIPEPLRVAHLIASSFKTLQ
ncbi:MAG: endonuclease dU [Candidatus Helarchaeota archaeon]